MWDREADVLVVGYGGAGATAAIAAHDAGAKVVILEKNPEGGGNTRYSGGSVRAFLDVEKVVAYIEGFSFGAVGRDMIKTFVEEAMKSPEWIRSLGGETEHRIKEKEFPPAPDVIFSHLPGADGVGTRLHVKGSTGREAGGVNLWGLLCRNVEERKIEVLLDTAAKRLVMNENKEVIGVIADSPNGEIGVKAKRATILTCGGFEFNTEMQLQYLGVTFDAFGTPGNTGDGIIMAQEVGADLWHMNGLSCGVGYKVPELESPVVSNLPSGGFIYVDQNGSRFMDDGGHDVHAMGMVMPYLDFRSLTRPRIPTYVIFDEDTRRSGPIVRTFGRYSDMYQWSEDNMAEIEKGWIKRGETIADLARQIGINAEALQKAVGDYNLHCVAGYDPDFNRDPATLVPIVRSPFYAIAIWPCLINTQGGPRRNTRAQVMNVRGEAIRRLYSAGELGSIWGLVYPGGGNVTECLAVGRIAGRNAAAEEPWNE